ncbi:MAG TPA: DUF6198 family protein [Pseudogracilibacillus sp.]|nr:DUF6198 family protein [Pseudogracilibacillus sp.]
MIRVDKIKSYGLFLLSLYIMGLGISLVTQAHLGTTSITSPSYVLSLSFPLSFGLLTMFLNFLFVILQIIILRKDFPKLQYLQLIIGPILGLAIDFWSYIILLFEQPAYWLKMLMVIMGCAVIAFSTVLQLKARVVNNPAEGIVKAISSKTGKNFGMIKLYFDITLVCIAMIISLITLNNIYGVREGTIISALIIGPFIKKIQQYIH